MKVTVLDGFRGTEGSALLRSMVECAAANGQDLEVLALRDIGIAPCVGCFGCWVRTPGACVMKDGGQQVTRTLINSDLLVCLTPVVFGGYSSLLKAALDRSICIIRPEFVKAAGETHHMARYASYPRLLGLGLLDRPDAEQESTFRFLVSRNALNFKAREARAVVVNGTDSASLKAEKIASAMRGWR
jgi:hypothetical protein